MHVNSFPTVDISYLSGNELYLNILWHDDNYDKSSLMAGSGVPVPLYGMTVSVFDISDAECIIIYDLNTLGFNTPGVDCFTVNMGASDPIILFKWNRSEIVLIVDLLGVNNDSGCDVPDIINGIKLWKNGLCTSGFGVPDVEILNDKNRIGKSYSDNVYLINNYDNRLYIFECLVNNVFMMLLCNENNIIGNNGENSNETNNNYILCDWIENNILTDCNNIYFIFYYYVKIYFDFYIPSIWSWIVINIFYEMFGIIVCVFWGIWNGIFFI